MTKQRVQAIIEALLLASDHPVTEDRLRSLLPEAPSGSVRDALRTLQLHYAGPSRGIHLVRINGGFQLRTNPAFGESIRHFFESQPLRLSRAAMETLAIIAYRQPLTRAEIEDIRGVNSSGVLSTLRDCALVEIVGQLDDIGKPHIYGTTHRFLEFFGLDALGDLPTLEVAELEAIIDNFQGSQPPEPAPTTTHHLDP